MKKRTKKTPRQRELANRGCAIKHKSNAGAQLRQGNKPRSARSKGKGRPARPGPSRVMLQRDLRPAGWLPGDRSAAEFHQTTLPVVKIKLGTRHRKDLGDVTALARDINERGLLHPIVVDRRNVLIAGERRLKAWQLSNFRERPIPVTIIPLADIIAGEWAENDPALRKDFTLSEAVSIKHAIEAKLKPKAAAQKGGRGHKAAARISTGDRAASFTGKSRRTIEKAERIVAAAERDPKRFGKLLEDMDKSGRADGPFKRLQTLTAAAEIRKAPPPAPGQGPYRGIIIDFPWAAEPEDDDPDRLARGYYPYPTMSMSQIERYCADVIRPVLHDDAIVAIWIPNFHLARGHQLPVLGALELKPSTILTWRKNLIGRGQVARGSTEHVIIARRGKAVIETPFPRTDFDAEVDRKNHSRKPQLFFDLFAKHVPAESYASFFDTVDRGALWDVHGVPHKKAERAAA